MFDTRLPACWTAALGGELDKPYMRDLAAFLDGEDAGGAVVYPPRGLVFEALRRTPLEAVRCVILGQDPYHGPGQAEGLAFSVPRGVRPPPSLRNILKELQADVGIPAPAHGNLSAWADRGVLLLNTSLTVRDGEAGSHAGKGWEAFTDRVIATVDARPGHVAFVLWGAHAQRKAAMLDQSRHLVHMSAHPSPLSARHGFFGSRPFSKVNAFLASVGAGQVDWNPS